MTPEPRVYWVLAHQLRDDTDMTQDRYDDSDWVKVVPCEALAQERAAVWKEVIEWVRGVREEEHNFVPDRRLADGSVVTLDYVLSWLEQQARGDR